MKRIGLARSVLGVGGVFVAVGALVGCGGAASYVHSDTTTLGRVVVYRNGVAFEHRATDAAYALYELIVTLGYE